MKIPIAKPLFDENEERAILEPLRSGWVMQGPKVQKFENIVSNYTGAKYAKSTSSGTAALHLSLLACGIRPGDEVIVSPFTCVATVNPIEYIGAKPVFVDINLETFNIDVSKIEEAITKNTKAIIPIHMFGLCADMEPIMKLAKKYKLKVIEDSVLALGSFYRGRHSGTFGDAGCFSFHPRKIITTGEGGMVITNSKEISHDIEAMRNYGASVSALKRHKKRFYVLPEYYLLGYNYKMTDLQASIGIKQMGKLKYILKKRKQLAKIYNQELENLDWLTIPKIFKGYIHAYSSYVCLFTPFKWTRDRISLKQLRSIKRKRNEFMKKLEEKGIATIPGNPAVHTLKYYKSRYHLREGDFPTSLIASNLSITLPLYPQMSHKEQNFVINSIKCFKLVK
ncbi:MAG: DegT/DnrJ/EryC1/StrS family aminotransferase [Deltaproteobacteria bacterium]|nr:MAG: DegT/DnrJ/EryC1/StrS family aminotransferase [Deltaproteobacteria bacterium]